MFEGWSFESLRRCEPRISHVASECGRGMRRCIHAGLACGSATTCVEPLLHCFTLIFLPCFHIPHSCNTDVPRTSVKPDTPATPLLSSRLVVAEVRIVWGIVFSLVYCRREERKSIQALRAPTQVHAVQAPPITSGEGSVATLQLSSLTSQRVRSHLFERSIAVVIAQGKSDRLSYFTSNDRAKQ